MKVQLNGEWVQTQGATLTDLLNAQGFGGAKVATAVNGTFVPAAARDAHVLEAGDSVEVLAPMQGG